VLIAGILLPALFHLNGGLIVFAFLAALIMVYGVTVAFIVCGAVAAFAFELWYGFYLGSLILAWLAAVAIWQVCTQFFNVEPSIKNYASPIFSIPPLLLMGYLLVGGMSVVFLFVEKYFYHAESSWDTLRLIVLSPMAWLITGCGIMACILILRLPGRKAVPAAGKFYI
jgi:hypothetical protein